MQMTQAYELWDQKMIARVEETLESLRPGPGQPDLRGIEWNLLAGLCHDEAASFASSLGTPNELTFLSDGRLVTCGPGGAVRIWTRDKHQPDLTLDHGDSHADRVAASAIGRWLAVGLRTGTIVLWSTAVDPPRRMAELNGELAAPVCIVGSPDGRTLAAGFASQVIEVWDVETLRRIHTLRIDTGEPDSLAFSPDGKLLACGERKGNARGEMKVWELPSGTLRHALQLDVTNYGSDVWFLPDGRLLSANHEGSLRFWDATTGAVLQRTELIGQPWSMVVAPDGSFAVIGMGSRNLWTELVLMDLKTGRVLARLKGHRFALDKPALSDDGQWLAKFGHNEPIKLWNIGEAVRNAAWSQTRCWGLAFTPDGNSLALGGPRTLRLLDPKSGQTLATHTAKQIVHMLGFSQDGRTLVALDQPRAWDRNAAGEALVWRLDQAAPRVIANPARVLCDRDFSRWQNTRPGGTRVRRARRSRTLGRGRH